MPNVVVVDQVNQLVLPAAPDAASVVVVAEANNVLLPGTQTIPIANLVITAGEALVVGDVVTVDAAAEAVLAASATVPGLWDAIGVVARDAAMGADALLASGVITKIRMRFAVAPLAANNGALVYLSTVPGLATLTPPGSGNASFQLGRLLGGNGSTLTPVVLFRPQLVAFIS